MILKRIKVYPFGGLFDTEQFFKKGLNVVLGPNEAGKSTLFHAIKKCLFINTNLTKSQFSKELQQFIPISGDTARVEIEFNHNGSTYLLRKSWGATRKSEMLLPDGSILTDEEGISSKMKELLPASEGTFSSVLMCYQSGLSRTIEDLKDKENAETLHNIGDLLRKMFLNTDGISVDEFRTRVNGLYDTYLGRWDLQKNEPERGRGIENPWIQGAGTVVKSFYAMKEAQRKLESAQAFEEAYDKLNKQIAEISHSISQKEEYVNRNLTTVEHAKERRTLNAELAQYESEIGSLKKDYNDWVATENSKTTIELSLAPLNEKFQSLREEKIAVERAEDSRTLREKYERAKPLKDTLNRVEVELSKAKKLDRQELEKIRETSAEVSRLSTSLEAGRLKAHFVSKSEIELTVQKGVEDPVRIKIPGAGIETWDAGGRIKISHSDWELTVTSGDSNFDIIVIDYENAKHTLEHLLCSCGVSSLDEAITINDEYEIKRQAVANAQSALDATLNGETFDELEKRIKDIGVIPPSRSLATVVSEFSRLDTEINSKKQELAKSKKQIEVFQQKYKTKDDLMEAIALKLSKQKATKTKLEQLQPLPPEIIDVDQFIRQFEEAKINLEQEKIQKNSLQIERAKREGQAPDQSLEELQLQFEQADLLFQVNVRKGRAIAKLKQTTEQLVEKTDTNTYAGLEEDIASYIAIITDNRYTQITMEESIPKGFVRNDGKLIPAELLSTGTKDVLGLAARLSIAKHFLGNAHGFVAMDDPLVDLDPTRQRKAVEVLQEFAEKKQVIVFTCHPQHAEMLGGNLCVLS